jgi:hypothetical protein
MDGFGAAWKPEWLNAPASITAGRFTNCNAMIQGGWYQSQNNQFTTMRFAATPAATTVYVSHGFRPSITAAYGCAFSQLRENGTSHLTLTIESDKQIRLRRGDRTGTVIGTSSLSIPIELGQWRHIEWRAVISDTTGAVEVRVDGVTAITYSGDTRNGGTVGAINDFGLQVFDFANYTDMMQLCDLFIWDESGTGDYTGWMGDMKIETLRPNGNGSANQLVGSDGNSVDNYLLVDETTPSASDYNGSATIGQRDLYAVSNLSSTAGNVKAVQVHAQAFKSDATAASMKVLTKSGVNENVSASFALPSTAGWIESDIQVAKPGGGSWTISDVNSMEIGAEVA